MRRFGRFLTRLLFVPALIASVLGLVWLCFQVFSLESSYLPVIVWMMILMGLIERLRPFRRAVLSRKHVTTDLVFILVNPVAIPLLWYVLFRPLFHLRLNPWNAFDSMPIAAQVLLFYGASEFLRYWMHRWQHEVPFLWRFHAVHHCMPQIYYLNQFVSHPLDYFMRNVLSFTPLVLFRFDPIAIAYAQALSTLFGMFGHANFSVSNGLWNYVFPTYEVHRWHHSVRPAESDANYGVGLLLWDHLFRTFHFPHSRGPERFGIEDPRYRIDEWKELMALPWSRTVAPRQVKPYSESSSPGSYHLE